MLGDVSKKYIHQEGCRAQQGISLDLESTNDWDPMVSKIQKERTRDDQANLMNLVQLPIM